MSALLKVYKRNVIPEGRLSPRQREVAQHLANGYSKKQIAGALGLTQRTVEYHLHGAMERFRVISLPALVYKMVRWGELPPGRYLSFSEIQEFRAVPYAFTSPASQKQQGAVDETASK